MVTVGEAAVSVWPLVSVMSLLAFSLSDSIFLNISTLEGPLLLTLSKGL